MSVRPYYLLCFVLDISLGFSATGVSNWHWGSLVFTAAVCAHVTLFFIHALVAELIDHGKRKTEKTE